MRGLGGGSNFLPGAGWPRRGPRWRGHSWQRGHGHYSVFMVGAAAKMLSWGACAGLGKQRVLGVTSLLTCALVKQDLLAGEEVGLLWVTSVVSSGPQLGSDLWVGALPVSWGKDRLGDGPCKEQNHWGIPESGCKVWTCMYRFAKQEFLPWSDMRKHLCCLQGRKGKQKSVKL